MGSLQPSEAVAESSRSAISVVEMVGIHYTFTYGKARRIVSQSPQQHPCVYYCNMSVTDAWPKTRTFRGMGHVLQNQTNGPDRLIHHIDMSHRWL